MKKLKKIDGSTTEKVLYTNKKRRKNKSWNYITAVVDIVREPMLVIDQNFLVQIANEPFCRIFQIKATEAEGISIYKIGNSQWDIPALHKLLEVILPKNNFFKDYEVVHDFEIIGNKSMILNVKEINTSNSEVTSLTPSIIIISFEDVTPLIAIAESLTLHVKEIATKNLLRTRELEAHVLNLEKQIRLFKAPQILNT